MPRKQKRGSKEAGTLKQALQQLFSSTSNIQVKDVQYPANMSATEQASLGKGGVLGDSEVDDSQHENESDKATPSLTPSRKSARQAERRAAKAFQALSDQSAGEDELDREGRRPSEARQKKRRVDKRNSDLLDSEGQTEQEEALPRAAAAHPVMLPEEKNKKAQLDHDFQDKENDPPNVGLDKQEAAREDSSSRPTTSQYRAPRNVTECDDFMRKVRIALQHPDLSAADAKRYKELEGNLLKRRQVFFQREQETFLTDALGNPVRFGAQSAQENREAQSAQENRQAQSAQAASNRDALRNPLNNGAHEYAHERGQAPTTSGTDRAAGHVPPTQTGRRPDHLWQMNANTRTGPASGLQNLNSQERAHFERAKKENERLKAELVRLRQELREKDGTITSLQRSVADALKQGRVPDFLTEKAIKKLRKVIFNQHLFGTAPWADLYADQDLLTNNFIAESDLASREDRAVMRKAFADGKGRHELTLFNNKRQTMAKILREYLLGALNCKPLPEDPAPTLGQIEARLRNLKKNLADGQWLHGSAEDAAGKLGGVAFFNGVSYALKGSKVHVDENEAICVPAKTLAFLVLAGEKALKDETFEPRNVLKDRQKVDMYEKKLLAYAAAKKLSKYFVLLQPDQKPEGRLPWHYYKVPCASESQELPSAQADYMSPEE